MSWQSKPESGGGATRDAIENVLGQSCTVRGNLSAEGAFWIDGTVEGSVESRAAVVVGESGSCAASCGAPTSSSRAPWWAT